MVVVLLDAAAPDAFGCYGATGDPTPAIDRLAEEGVRCENAFSVATWTTPSVASLLTGLHPVRHGVVGQRYRLGDSAPTVAGRLSEAGWRTFAVLSNVNASPVMGLHRGFEGHVQLPEHRQLIDGYLAPVAEFMDGAGGGDVHLFVHVLQPHAPYRPPTEFMRRFVPAGYTGTFDGTATALVEVNEGQRDLDQEDLAHVRALYQANVAYADAVVGDLRTMLESRGRGDALWVVTSDHGEAFGEHGRVLHGGDPYDEEIRIPMVMRGVGRGVHEGLVSILDVAPTILAAVGLDRGGLDGRDLGSLTSRQGGGQRPLVWGIQTGQGAAPAVRSGVPFGDRIRGYWLRTMTAKVIFYRDRPPVIYDLAADPGEQTDKGGPASVREVVLQMKNLLEGLGEPYPVRLLSKNERIDVLQELERLGYVESDE